MHNAQCTMHNDLPPAAGETDCHGLQASLAMTGEKETAKEILEKLAAWVQAQEADKLSVQNLKHATGVLKDLREILKSDMPDKPVEIIVQIGDGEYAE